MRVCACACVWGQLEQLKSELAADRETLLSSESLSTDLMKEKALLEKTLETLRENSDTQVRYSLTCTQDTQTHAHLLTNSLTLSLTYTQTHTDILIQIIMHTYNMSLILSILINSCIKKSF